MKIAVFVSGRGSNLQAILESQKQFDKFEVSAVVSDKFDCAAFEIAKNFSIPTFTVGNKERCISFNDLSNLFFEYQIELIVLAGFLKLLPNEFVNQFNNKIINIHPALLPSFGGKGMYGLNVHKAVFESSAKVSGASVHFVDPTYDTGKIIAQRCVDISDVKSPEEIAERVLKIEHQILPYVIDKFADGKIKIIDNRVVVID
ncbi:MAG: phosphoribosylglycinamide formyltransferase [Bacteroidetes bacterium]|nr:phosphoribosylglycinamide formyltransferase [Bacteroidota bacterium]